MQLFGQLLLALPLQCLALNSFSISAHGELQPTADVYKTEVNISKYLNAMADKDLAMMACSLPTSLKFEALEGGTKPLQDAIESNSSKIAPFLWLRYGDGEIASMTGMGVSNCDGADMDSKCVRDGLIEAFLGNSMTGTPVVVQAVGGFFLCKETHGTLNEKMDAFATAHADHKYSYVNTFYLPIDWAKLSKTRPVVLVGPKHLDSLHCMLGHVAFFEVSLPTSGCDEVDPLVQKMTEISKTEYPTESVFFAIAGGGVGKIAAYKAFQKLQDKDIIVDVGSSLDGYAGKGSRDYNKDIPALCEKHKEWMAYDVCQNQCQGIRADVPCKQCNQ